MITELIELSRRFLTLKSRPYARYFLKQVPLEHRCLILLGQRGVGKTTTLIQYLLAHSKGDIESHKILYLQADHFLIGNSSLYEIADQFQALGGEIIAFDEIHKYQTWSKELKSIYDTFPELTILASGSSALEIYKGSHDLSRRALIYRLYGLSFREYLELRFNIRFEAYELQIILADHAKIAREIVEALNHLNEKILVNFKDYLSFGYFPYFFEINNQEAYWLTLEQNVHMTLESDLIAVHSQLTGSSINKMKLLLNYIATAVPFTVNWKKLKTMIGVSDDRTIKSYFQYLDDACLIKKISPYSQKLRGISADEKIYLDNTNQIQAISSGSGNVGNIRETYFINMLKVHHKIALASQGDFIIDGQYTFEIGGKNKNHQQIYSIDKAYLGCDNIEVGALKRIPLWLFGFLY